MASHAQLKDQGFDCGVALARCATGDKAALKALYDSEAPRLLAVARRIVRRAEVAEDVVQEAFLQIWRKAGTYDQALGSGRAWITAVVRNRALNAIRDDRLVPMDDDTLGAIAEAGTDVEDALARLSERSALRRCLDQLEPRRRASLVLAYVRGYSHGEVAGLLGVPLGTAKAWIRRSLVTLKDCLA